MFTLLEIALSIGVLVVMISALTACVCGCKNSNQKSELVGTAGVVKLRFEEEVPSPTPTTPASVKRASTQNSQRSLPEIPHPVGRHDSGDTASEIYATVNLDEGNKAVATTSSSRDHPYEHAYAKLQNEAHNITVEITPDPESEDVIEIDEREVTQSGPESVVISASVAISGQLPSSQELPYITPPSPRPNDAAVHFSGDSTDSAKGYTSISVREPLSNIRAQVAKRPSQPHYATVSDDSDEMYAAIEEASTGGGSDTYAQIANNAPDMLRTEAILHTNASSRRSAPPEIMASTSSATHQATQSRPAEEAGSPKPEKRQANSPLPPPPAHPAPPAPASRLDLLAHAHQRISSTGDLFNHDKLRRSVNEKHQRNNSCVSSSDFYGCNYPVEKHRFSSGDLVRPLVAKELNFDLSDNHYNSIEASSTNEHSIEPTASLETASPSRNIDDMYAKVNKKKHKDEPDETKPKFRANDPGYETIDRKNHGYETIARKDHKQDPGYETVKEVKTTLNFNNNNLKLNQASVDSGPNSIISSDPGYEHISKTDHNASDSDPNYEVLRNNPSTPPYATIAPDYKLQPTYSTVNKKQPKYNNWPANNNEEIVEPNYESMPHDPLYTTGSESDPNYESVRPKYDSGDPNYESLRSKHPKYESVGLRDSMRSKKDPNYESVKYFDVSKSDPPYERVRNDASSSGIERSDSAAGYEKINVQNNKNSINGADATVGDYFQV